jgi:hypothetical protein
MGEKSLELKKFGVWSLELLLFENHFKHQQLQTPNPKSQTSLAPLFLFFLNLLFLYPG